MQTTLVTRFYVWYSIFKTIALRLICTQDIILNLRLGILDCSPIVRKIFPSGFCVFFFNPVKLYLWIKLFCVFYTEWLSYMLSVNSAVLKLFMNLMKWGEYIHRYFRCLKMKSFNKIVFVILLIEFHISTSNSRIKCMNDQHHFPWAWITQHL